MKQATETFLFASKDGPRWITIRGLYDDKDPAVKAAPGKFIDLDDAVEVATAAPGEKRAAKKAAKKKAAKKTDG